MLLRLHVTGLMNNAYNLITISCFWPKSSMANLLIQLLYQELYSLNHPFEGQMCFSVFAAENLSLRFSFYESETGPRLPWLTPLMQAENTGAHSLREN